ncbi:hypothetical protein CYMTET_32422 [Cymbomonas tetramitiformis]|uniref:Uncharacterized protein n=1 Tax=Cymbomonas tetramitiformis TaxID=36881 RepID=A0AAE0FF47_9CHLO|nr:hypothetical protein CYMTET_32422 [Cymbomonas tetramitiformis]
MALVPATTPGEVICMVCPKVVSSLPCSEKKRLATTCKSFYLACNVNETVPCGKPGCSTPVCLMSQTLSLVDDPASEEHIVMFLRTISNRIEYLQMLQEHDYGYYDVDYSATDCEDSDSDAEFAEEFGDRVDAYSYSTIQDDNGATIWEEPLWTSYEEAKQNESGDSVEFRTLSLPEGPRGMHLLYLELRRATANWADNYLLPQLQPHHVRIHVGYSLPSVLPLIEWLDSRALQIRALSFAEELESEPLRGEPPLWRIGSLAAADPGTGAAALQSLDLDYSVPNNFLPIEHELGAIAALCPNLWDFRIAHLANINISALTRVLSQLPRLRRLDLGHGNNRPLGRPLLTLLGDRPDLLPELKVLVIFNSMILRKWIEEMLSKGSQLRWFRTDPESIGGVSIELRMLEMMMLEPHNCNLVYHKVPGMCW